MTVWADSFNSKYSLVKKSKAEVVRDKFLKCQHNVSKHVMKVFVDVLSKDTNLVLIPCGDSSTIIERLDEKFKLSVYHTPGRHTTIRVDNISFGVSVFKSEFFFVSFNKKLGKIRKSALILRKKFQMRDIYVVDAV